MREIAERCKEIVVEFLKERGLELSDEKTEIVHISEGFDFIGWNFRKFKEKFLIQPSKKAVAAIISMLSETVKSAKAWGLRTNRSIASMLSFRDEQCTIAMHHHAEYSASLTGDFPNVMDLGIKEAQQQRKRLDCSKILATYPDPRKCL